MTAMRIGESRITSKGQITLPKKIAENLGAKKGDYIIFSKEGSRIYIDIGDITPRSRR